MWFVRLLKLLYQRRRFAAKMTRFPIIGDLIEKIVFHGDSLVCLPKDTVIQVNKAVDLQGEMVLPSQVVEHFVEIAKDRWIMNFCICRESNKCRDYPRDLGCLFLGEAVRGINPKLGRLVTKEEALAHLENCREAGLVHFIGKVRGDALWLGVHPDEKLLTICSCCPCCCISALIKDMAPQIAENYTKMPGVEVTVTERCVGCGTCVKTCFVEAIHIINNRAVINEAICRGCGRCAENCPKTAIKLTINDSEFLQKTIQRIVKHVDLS